MRGATIRISNAQQAKLNNSYKNTKLKLLKTKAAIWFNKMCKVKQRICWLTIKVILRNARCNNKEQNFMFC